MGKSGTGRRGRGQVRPPPDTRTCGPCPITACWCGGIVLRSVSRICVDRGKDESAPLENDLDSRVLDVLIGSGRVGADGGMGIREGRSVPDPVVRTELQSGRGGSGRGGAGRINPPARRPSGPPARRSAGPTARRRAIAAPPGRRAAWPPGLGIAPWCNRLRPGAIFAFSY